MLLSLCPASAFAENEATDGAEAAENAEEPTEPDASINTEEDPDPEEIQSAVYSITVDTTENGTVTADKQTAAEGEKITLTVLPDEGYEAASVLINDNPIVPDDSGYAFTMPACDVTVTANFSPVKTEDELEPEVSDTPEEEPAPEDTNTQDEEPVPEVATVAPEYEYTEIEGYNVPAGLSVQTYSEYPWTTYNGSQTLISGNKNVSSSASVIKVTVTGPGTLSFQYRVYSGTTANETAPDSLLISVGTEITADISYSTFSGQRYYGETGWQVGTVVLNVADTDSTDVYFAYRKNGSGDYSEDFALLKDIAFSSGKSTVTALSSDSAYGSVTGGGDYVAGDSITLNAALADGAKCYGWLRDGVWLDTDSESYTFTVAADTTVTALLGSASATIAQNRTTGAIYTDLTVAFSEALSGDVIQIVNNSTMTTDATIPAGVTLYIPYSAIYDEDGNADGTVANSGSAFAGADKTFRCLTVANGATLTVNGTLLIGGVIGYPSQLYQGHTSGDHGRLTNNGKIQVTGGRINCYGFIDGTGTLEAITGSVYEPFVVYDFSGGNNTLSLYEAGQNPFMQYTMQNISCVLTVHDTAAYGAFCNLYASSQYNKTDAVLIGGSETAPVAMVKLGDGAYLTRTVDKTKSISGGTSSGTYGADIYKTVYTIVGGAALSNMQMQVYGVDVSVNQYPIPYCFTYVLTGGSYTIPKGWTLLPGAEITVAAGSDLSVAGKLFVTDGLVNTGMSGRYYPSSAKLSANGFATCGVLRVNGTLNLLKGSTFGGIVQTGGSGKIVVQQNVTLSNTVQIGATGTYDDNTCIMELNGRIMKDGALTNLLPGTTYNAVNGSSWTLEGFTVTSYAKQASATQPTEGKWTKPGSGSYWIYGGPETFTTNQTMYGAFSIAETVKGITVMHKTYYSDTDTSRTEVSTPEVSGSTATFTVSRTEDGAAYNYIVKVAEGSGEAVTVKPDSSGVYTVTGIQDTITITVISVKKGDVNLNGSVAANDVTILRRKLAGYVSFAGEFNEAAADVNGNGTVAANDLTKLRRFMAGYISSL